MKSKENVHIVTATEAKNRFGEIIKAAYLREEHLIVTRDGIPVAAIIPITDYKQLLNGNEIPAELAEEIDSAARRQRAHNSLSAYLKEVHERMPKMTEEEAEQAEREILEAIHTTRAEERGEREQQAHQAQQSYPQQQHTYD